MKTRKKGIFSSRLGIKNIQNEKKGSVFVLDILEKGG